MSATNEVQLFASKHKSQFLIPRQRKLCQFYGRLEVDSVFSAWRIEEVVSQSRHNSVSMMIQTPGGWRAEEAMNNDMLRSWFVKDQKGQKRMSVVHSYDSDSAKTYIRSPVEMRLEDNETFAGYVSKKPKKPSEAWVEVLLHGKKVFASTKIPAADIDCLDADRVDRLLEPLYQQAEGFIKEKFPLLLSDPAAYW